MSRCHVRRTSVNYNRCCVWGVRFFFLEINLDDPLSSLSLGELPVEALIIFFVSLPCVIFFALGYHTLRYFGVIRARRLAEDGQKAFEPFVNNAESYFLTLNIMETLSVIMMLACGYSLLATWLQPWAVWLILGALFLVVDLLFLRFFGRSDEYRLAERYVKGLRPLCMLLTPITFLLGLILKPFTKADSEERFTDADRVEDELELMVDESTKHGALQSFQGRIMRSAIDFGDTTVREVMIPRTDLTLCDVNMKFEEAIRLCVQEGYSRLPVYEDDPDNIVGILYYKDLMRRMFELESEPEKRAVEPIRNLVREVSFVPETKHIQDLFTDFQREHYHMAVVIDEFGGTAGIVTLEDILEEFFGEIQDEYDAEECAIVPVDDNGNCVKVDAKTNVEDVSELFDVEIEENPDFDTIGGLVTYELGRVGVVGDEVTVAGLKFRVTEANEKCILKVEVSRIEPENQDEQAQ